MSNNQNSPEIIVYSSAVCPYCDRAKALLDRKGLAYQEIRVDLDEHKRIEMMERSGRRTVPQIFINGNSIGGCDDLYALEKQGFLDKII
jgi:glutaredoxin 3